MKPPSPLLGFNNNVRHKGRVFHIQTEDSGVRHPHIITHLFADGGRILKTTKTSYAEFIDAANMGEVVRQMMQDQHKAMFMALRDGQFDHIVEELPGGRGSQTGKVSAQLVSAAQSGAAAQPAAAPAATAAQPAAAAQPPAPAATAAQPAAVVQPPAPPAAPAAGAAQATATAPVVSAQPSATAPVVSAQPSATAPPAGTSQPAVRPPAAPPTAAPAPPTAAPAPPTAPAPAPVAAPPASVRTVVVPPSPAAALAQAAKPQEAAGASPPLRPLASAPTQPAVPVVLPAVLPIAPVRVVTPPETAASRPPVTAPSPILRPTPTRVPNARPRLDIDPAAIHRAPEPSVGPATGTLASVVEATVEAAPGIDLDTLERAAAEAETPLFQQIRDLPPPPAAVLGARAAAGTSAGGYSSITAPGPAGAPPPSTRGRYAPSRPSSIFASVRPTEGASIFGEDLISEKSLDEVILSYLAEDLDGPGEKK